MTPKRMMRQSGSCNQQKQPLVVEEVGDDVVAEEVRPKTVHCQAAIRELVQQQLDEMEQVVVRRAGYAKVDDRPVAAGFLLRG